MLAIYRTGCSEDGAGSPAGSGPTTPERDVTDPGVSGSAVRVLVVDDHQDTCLLTGRVLIGTGREVRVANSFRAALSVATEWPPHVLLCDLTLPDGDGCDLLAQVRAIAPAVRAVAVTGSGSEADLQRCEQAGFDAFLLKPVAIDELIAAVQATARPGRVAVRTGERPRHT